MLIVTDLDGTILPKDGSIDERDTKALQKLQQNGHITAIATGRLHEAILRVIPSDFPVDYVIFSAGNGICDWKTKEIVHLNGIPKEKLLPVIELAQQEKQNFAVFENPPRSRYLHHSISREDTPDFFQLVERAGAHASAYTGESCLPATVGQMLIGMTNSDDFERLASRIQGVSVVRTTSPIDNASPWMEIYAEGIDKGSGIDWVARKHGIAPADILAFGNDYNDLAMLHLAGKAYVVENAPKELKEKFHVTLSVEQTGLAHALAHEFPDLYL